MKKTLGVLAVIGLLAVPAIAGATDSCEKTSSTAPNSLAGYVEATVWEWQVSGDRDCGSTGGQWIAVTNDQQNAVKAKAFKSPVAYASYCNAESRYTNLGVKASVAQWLNVELSSTEWQWFIKKPGTYLADCIGLKIKSNNEVAVDFDIFKVGVTNNDDLNYMADDARDTLFGLDRQGWESDEYDKTDVNEKDGASPKVKFAIKPVTETTPPTSFDYFDDLEGQIPGIRGGNGPYAKFIQDTNGVVNLDLKLWNRIEVSDQVPFGNYYNFGTITFTLRDQMNWLNVNGLYAN